MPNTVTAKEALLRLKEGNKRYTAHLSAKEPLSTHTIRDELKVAQEPFAIILGCSDSRVPTELIFDQSLGDLFVIRVAGNIATPSQIGSVEFAASQFATRLVVVLGHSKCGAVNAAINELASGEGSGSKNLDAIVDRVKSAVKGLMATDLKDDMEALKKEAVRANVRLSANDLQRESEILEKLIKEEGLTIVGAEYSLETGIVEFLDDIRD